MPTRAALILPLLLPVAEAGWGDRLPWRGCPEDPKLDLSNAVPGEELTEREGLLYDGECLFTGAAIHVEGPREEHVGVLAGAPQGLTKIWIDGQPRSEETWALDRRGELILDGPARYWWGDGGPREAGQFAGGRRAGVWQTWDRDGRPAPFVIYHHDRVIGQAAADLADDGEAALAAIDPGLYYDAALLEHEGVCGAVPWAKGELVSATACRGVAWHEDGSIVFPSEGALRRWGASGEERWALPIEGLGRDVRVRAAVASGGDTWIAGDLIGDRLSLGDYELQNPQAQRAQDTFIARISADGAARWARAIGGTERERVEDLTVGPDGGAVIVGTSPSERLAIGDLVHENPAGTDAFVLKLDADGQPLWLAGFGSDAPDPHTAMSQGRAVDIGADGAIYLAGHFRDPELQLGGYTFTNDTGRFDLFVARLTPDGEVEWALQGGGPDDQQATAIAAAPDGGFALGGYGAPFRFPFDEIGGDERGSWIARFYDDGGVRWARVATGRGSPTQLGFDADGGVRSIWSCHVSLSLGGLEIEECKEAVDAAFDTNGEIRWLMRPMQGAACACCEVP